MPQRIARFSVGQTAKVIGILYGLMGLVFIPVFLIIGKFAPEGQSFGIGFALAMPILYGCLGFVFAALGCVLYNWVAGWAGGIEVELGSAPPA
jgi:hypothetical protein